MVYYSMLSAEGTLRVVGVNTEGGELALASNSGSDQPGQINQTNLVAIILGILAIVDSTNRQACRVIGGCCAPCLRFRCLNVSASGLCAGVAWTVDRPRSGALSEAEGRGLLPVGAVSAQTPFHCHALTARAGSVFGIPLEPRLLVPI